YAGVVTFLEDDELPHAERYRAWLMRLGDAGLPIAILGHLGLPADPALLARLGVDPIDRPLIEPLQVRQQSALLGFEVAAEARRRELVPLRARAALTVHAAVEDAAGQRAIAVATGPAGGLALDPFVVQLGSDGQRRWILNPFEFFKLALHLPAAP